MCQVQGCLPRFLGGLRSRTFPDASENCNACVIFSSSSFAVSASLKEKNQVKGRALFTYHPETLSETAQVVFEGAHWSLLRIAMPKNNAHGCATLPMLVSYGLIFFVFLDES